MTSNHFGDSTMHKEVDEDSSLASVDVNPSEEVVMMCSPKWNSDEEPMSSSPHILMSRSSASGTSPDNDPAPSPSTILMTRPKGQRERCESRQSFLIPIPSVARRELISNQLKEKRRSHLKNSSLLRISRGLVTKARSSPKRRKTPLKVRPKPTRQPFGSKGITRWLVRKQSTNNTIPKVTSERAIDLTDTDGLHHPHPLPRVIWEEDRAAQVEANDFVSPSLSNSTGANTSNQRYVIKARRRLNGLHKNNFHSLRDFDPYACPSPSNGGRKVFTSLSEFSPLTLSSSRPQVSPDLETPPLSIRSTNNDPPRTSSHSTPSTQQLFLPSNRSFLSSRRKGARRSKMVIEKAPCLGHHARLRSPALSAGSLCDGADEASWFTASQRMSTQTRPNSQPDITTALKVSKVHLSSGLDSSSSSLKQSTLPGRKSLVSQTLLLNEENVCATSKDGLAREDHTLETDGAQEPRINWKQLDNILAKTREHLKVRRVQCPVCFSNQNNIVEHLRKVHTKILDPEIAFRYGLSICGCGKAFRSLLSHARKSNCTLAIKSPSLNLLIRPLFQASAAAIAQKLSTPTILPDHLPMPTQPLLVSKSSKVCVSILEVLQSSNPSESQCTEAFQLLARLPTRSLLFTERELAAFRLRMKELLKAYNENPTALNMVTLLCFPKLALQPVYRKGLSKFPLVDWIAKYPLLVTAQDYHRIHMERERKHDTGLSRKSLRERVRNLIEVNETTKAAKLLSSTLPLAETSLATRDKLQALHPHEDPLIWRNPDPAHSPSTKSITEGKVKDVIKKCKNPTSGGISGYTGYFVRCIGPSKEFVLFIQDLAKGIGKGSVPYKDMLLACRIIALQKPNNGVRPIAIGEIFYRLVANVLLNTFTEYTLLPYQLGVGTPGGTEPIVHALDVLCEKYALISLDLANAFNSMFRSWILAALRKHAPQYVLVFLCTYGSWTNLHFHQWIIKSKRGVRQGDPFGPFFFSIGYMVVLEEMPHCLFCRYPKFAYLDDTYLPCVVENATALFPSVRQFFQSKQPFTGLMLNAEKCKTSFPTTFNTSGLDILGTHIGIGGCDFWTQWMAPWEKNLHRLLLLHPADAMLILRKHLMPRVSYLLRTLKVHTSSWESMDKVVEEFVKKLLNRLGPLTFDPRRLFLPVRSGGCGLGCGAAIKQLAFDASRQESLRFILFAGSTLSIDHDPLQLLSQLTSETQKADSKRVYYGIELDVVRDWEMMESSSSPFLKLSRLTYNLDLKSPLSTYWFTTPMLSSVAYLTPKEYCVSLASLLRAVFPRCQMCYQVKINTQHLEHCGLTRWNRVQRHDSLQTAFASIFQDNLLALEPLTTTPNSQLRADLLVKLKDVVYAADLCVISTQVQRLQLSKTPADNIRGLMTHMFNRKHAKYRNETFNGRFLPLIFTTGGNVDEGTANFMNAMDEELLPSPSTSTITSFLLAQARSRQMLRSLNKKKK